MQEAQREIRNVALLDLTGATSDETLAGVSRIANVAAILVPERLLAKLLAIPMHNVAATVPVPDGKAVKVMSGQMTLSGEALASSNSSSDEVLVVAGQLFITTPVEHVGYAQLIVIGQVIAPAGSETALGAGLTRMSGQVAYYPYTPGGTVRLLTNSTRMSGTELANRNGKPTDVLVAAGQLIVSGPVESVGYEHIVALGQLLLPRESESAVDGRLTAVGGQVVFYSASPRAFNGKDAFSAGFFELLDTPTTLVLNGKFAFDEDVSPALLRRHVAEIVLNGKIVAPRALLPMLQLLTIARNGSIKADDADDD
jgi:hypothetical protein